MFSIDADTGVLTFSSAPDFESPGDVGTNNVYDVEVTVTDSGGLTDVQALQVSVTDVNEVPTITSAASVNVPENQTAVIDVQSTDPEGDTEGFGLSYSLTGGADQALFGIVASTGVLTFNAAPDFEIPGDAGGNNVYDVQVTVTDNGAPNLSDAQAIAVTVIAVNETGLVGHWTFDETSGSTAADSAGGDNPGTLIGASFVNDATRGGVLGLSGGDDRVEVGPVVDLGSTWTIASWFNTLGTGTWKTLTRGSDGDHQM